MHKHKGDCYFTNMIHTMNAYVCMREEYFFKQSAFVWGTHVVISGLHNRFLW